MAQRACSAHDLGSAQPENDELDEADAGAPGLDPEPTPLRAYQPSGLTKAQTDALEATEPTAPEAEDPQAQAPTAKRAPRPRPAHIARDNMRLTTRWQMV